MRPGPAGSRLPRTRFVSLFTVCDGAYLSQRLRRQGKKGVVTLETSVGRACERLWLCQEWLKDII